VHFHWPEPGGQTECGGSPLRGGPASLRLVATVVDLCGAWSRVVRDIRSLGSLVCGERRVGNASLGLSTLSNLADCSYLCTINEHQKTKREKKKARGPRIAGLVY